MDLEEEIILTMLIIINEKKRMNLRRRHYLTRAALTEPNQSAWREIKNSKDDMAFLDTTGMTYAVFLELLKAFKKCWDGPIVQSRGRKRVLTIEDVLGLVLHYLNSCMRQKTLAEVFGIVPSSVSKYLCKGLGCLLLALETFAAAKVKWPSLSEVLEYGAMINSREPLLTHSFGFVDGLNVPVQESGDPDIQNAYYNGYLCACYVSNVFVFAPNGKIIFAAINRPGSWHDSQVARKLYDKLRDETPGLFDLYRWVQYFS